ncbi:MAG TPA: ABC transporter substrate-binding protein [Candidatus Acidoferrales bacterium]|nr:ABC transporter substrate-binding protein [Candidatus Acidoferrales bacterium]
MEALGQNLERAIMAVPGIGLSQLPAFVAQDKGFYKQERLEVLMVVMDGTIATGAMIGGDIDYNLALASGVSALLNGAPVKVVMGMTTRGTQSFVVKPEIVSAADLKGKIVGVSGFGGSTHHGALFVLEHLGVDPKDVAILNVGNSSLRLAALRFKKIDATILDTAFLRKAEELGFKRLVSLADLGEIPSTGLVVTATKLKKQPEQIRRVVRATLKGTNYFKENRGEMISFIAKKLSVETKEAEELHELGVKVFSNSGRISDEGLNVLLRQRDPKRQVPIQPSDVVDWSFLPTR